MSKKSTRTPAQQAALEKARAARLANAAAKAAAEVADEELDKEAEALAAQTDAGQIDDLMQEQTGEAKAAAESAANAREMGAALEADEKVSFIIPLDPDLGSQNQMWERAFNNLVLRFKRGVPLMQPRYIVDYVNSCLRLERRSKESVAEFQAPGGKKLNY